MLKKIFLAAAGLFAISSQGVENIKPAEANRLLDANKAVLIDVREMAELKESGIAKPAAWLPKSEIDGKSDIYKGLVKNFDKKTPLIFYCRSGKRAAAAAAHFEGLGFKALVLGSLADWKAAGLPVVPFEERK